MTVKALKIVAALIKQVLCSLHAHINFTRLNFLAELFCVGVKNWVKELAASDVIGVEREKVKNISGDGKRSKQRNSIEIHHTNASSNRWKLIQQQRVHENCDKLKLHASIKVIHEISLLGRDSCYRCCVLLLCVSHWSSKDKLSSTRSDQWIISINLFAPTTSTTSTTKDVSLFTSVYDFI